MNGRMVYFFFSRIAHLLILCALGVLLWQYGRQWLAVDRCLDAGGAYDYHQNQCIYK